MLTMLDFVLMIRIHQIYGFQISTAKLVGDQSWHALIMQKMRFFKKVRWLTLPEIEFFVMLVDQKFANHVWFVSSTRAKIVTGLVFVHFVLDFFFISCVFTCFLA